MGGPGRTVLRQGRPSGEMSARQGAGHGHHGGFPLLGLLGRSAAPAGAEGLAGSFFRADEGRPSRPHRRGAAAAERQWHRAGMGTGRQRDDPRPAVGLQARPGRHGQHRTRICRHRRPYRLRAGAVRRLHTDRPRGRQERIPAHEDHSPPGRRMELRGLREKPRNPGEIRSGLRHGRYVTLPLLGT